jgi:hypothetical protein
VVISQPRVQFSCSTYSLIRLYKTFRVVKGDVVPHHEVTRPRQFMRDRFECDNPSGTRGGALGGLALIKAFRSIVVAYREVGRLDKGPSQVFIAVFGIAPAFLFAIAEFLTADTATIRGEVDNLPKALDTADTQQIAVARTSLA